jgi:hypothetical protein
LHIFRELITTHFRMHRLNDANILASKVHAPAVLFLLISAIEN